MSAVSRSVPLHCHAATCVFSLLLVLRSVLLRVTPLFLLIMSHTVLLIVTRFGLFVYRSVSTVDQRPAVRIMAHAYSVVQESVQCPST